MGRDDVLGREVFGVGGRAYTWGDVVAAAGFWSDWGHVEQRARRNLDLLTESPNAVPPEDVEAAQNDFRYTRNLLAADDLEAWLELWDVTVDQWAAQVRASVLREAGVEAPPVDHPEEELADAVWAEAVCAGELDRLAAKLARRCAIWDAADEAQPQELGTEELGRIDDAFDRFCEAALTDDALARRLQDERLAWTRIEGRYLAHPDEDVVRETALGVREEGRDLEEMARAAGARYEPAARFYLSDAGAELKTRLLAASPGELHGPVPSGEEHWLLEVRARVSPSLDDPEVRDRAATTVTESAVEQEMLRRVSWRERPT